jgi:hypothetical protein
VEFLLLFSTTALIEHDLFEKDRANITAICCPAPRTKIGTITVIRSQKTADDINAILSAASCPVQPAFAETTSGAAPPTPAGVSLLTPS